MDASHPEDLTASAGRVSSRRFIKIATWPSHTAAGTDRAIPATPSRRRPAAPPLSHLSMEVPSELVVPKLAQIVVEIAMHGDQLGHAHASPFGVLS